MLDVIILSTYFVITLYIGIKSGTNIKTGNEYIVSSRNFSTPVLVATIFATGIGGGSIFSVAEKFHDLGLIFMLVLAGSYVSQIIVALFVVPRMSRFLGGVSVGDLVGKVYGGFPKTLAGIVAVLVSIGFVAAQFNAFRLMITYFYGIPEWQGIVICAFIVIVYTSFGGIKSVIMTDIFQFVITIMAIPLLLKIGIHEVGGIEKFVFFISDKFAITSFANNEVFYINLLLAVSLIGFNPSLIQRILIAKDRIQATNSVLMSAILTIPFYFTVGLIGLVVLQLNSSIAGEHSVSYLVDNYLPDGVKGLIVAGILASIMSTADSDLNIAASTLYRDIISVKWHHIKRPILVIRSVTVLLGVVAVFIACMFDAVLDVILFTTNFWAPTILIPLLTIIWGKRYSNNYFYISFFGGIVVTVLWNYFAYHMLAIDGQIVGVISCTGLFVIFEYFVGKSGAKKTIRVSKS